MTDDYSTDFREDLIASNLSFAGVEEQRRSLLSSPRRCLEILQQGDTTWDALVALCLHVNADRLDLHKTAIDWRAAVSEPVLNAVAETNLSRPTFIGEYLHEDVPFDADMSRHIHSRVAASLLIRDEEPEQALHLLESVNEILPPRTQVRLSRDLSYEFVERVRRPLQQLYEQSGNYELALQLHRLSGKWASPEKHYDIAEFYLDRWTAGLRERATVWEAKTVLDAIYSLLIDSEHVDEEVRESLGECPSETRQFWAWFYGRTVGLLKIEHPYLTDALLYELDASDWVEGWAAASLLVEEHSDWMAHRRTCMTLYSASDTDYKGARPWNARQPPHMSPSSDLYWAMRVGYCDTHIESGLSSAEPSTTDLGEKLERIEQIVSSGGLRQIRLQQEVKQGFASLMRATPTGESARKILEADIGHEMLDSLPTAIVEHLVAAWLARLQGRPDDARVATVKAIEAVFTRLIRPRLHDVNSKLQIHITRPNGTQWTCPVGRMSRIQLAEWAAILPDLVRRKGENRKLRNAFSQAFQSIDWKLLGRCEVPLREAANARGQSAHDADRESYDLALEEADRLWSIAVGSIATPGLIPTLCTALGVGPPEAR